MKNKPTIEQLNQLNNGTMMEQLQIEYLKIDGGFLKAKMPVNEKTIQPDGILHGGASLALAETVAGLGSALLVDLAKYNVRGAQVSANHVGTVTTGWVMAEARLIHKGKNTHIWNIDIKTESDRMVSICRITNFIVGKE
ncbi:MAG: hotdog fold thioesterase [Bacteroidales bacterium]|nr:hotdog fold thioesterase [Bacteroidales bacterium]